MGRVAPTNTAAILILKTMSAEEHHFEMHMLFLAGAPEGFEEKLVEDDTVAWLTEHLAETGQAGTEGQLEEIVKSEKDLDFLADSLEQEIRKGALTAYSERHVHSWTIMPEPSGEVEYHVADTAISRPDAYPQDFKEV